PPLERLDQLNHLSLVVGFPTVTLGVLLGFGVRYAGGVSVDAAQVVWGMLMWLVLGWAVGVRVVRHWAGRRAAFASIELRGGAARVSRAQAHDARDAAV